MNSTNNLFDNTSNHNNAELMSFNHIILCIAALALVSAGAFVFGRYVCQPSTAKCDDHKLLSDAISRCKYETDQQNSEVKIIISALNEFDQESRFFIAKNGFFKIAPTERTALLELRYKEECSQLLAELMALMGNYPESGYQNNPCLQTVELYIEARKDHHDKIMSIATILIPNLNVLIAPVRAANNTSIYQHRI